MKKLLVKSEFIVTPYSPAVPGIPGVEAQPEKWVKGEEIVFEEPQDLTDWVYHPAVEAVEAIAEIPEVLEVKETRVIAQTQGSDEELAQWLAGDSFKYPEGYWVEYIDLEQDFDYLLAKCHSLRASEYPSLGDQADAAFKARQGDNSQQLAIDTLIEAVKAKYPKPQAV